MLHKINLSVSMHFLESFEHENHPKFDNYTKWLNDEILKHIDWFGNHADPINDFSLKAIKQWEYIIIYSRIMLISLTDSFGKID